MRRISAFHATNQTTETSTGFWLAQGLVVDLVQLLAIHGWKLLLWNRLWKFQDLNSNLVFISWGRELSHHREIIPLNIFKHYDFLSCFIVVNTRFKPKYQIISCKFLISQGKGLDHLCNIYILSRSITLWENIDIRVVTACPVYWGALFDTLNRIFHDNCNRCH